MRERILVTLLGRGYFSTLERDSDLFDFDSMNPLSPLTVSELYEVFSDKS
jgi:hypothetical protein